MRNIIDLKGKNILVIGASSGIGRAVAVLTSEVGAKVSVVARRKEKLQETLELMDKDGEHEMFVFDVSCLEETKNMIETIVNQRGRLDGLVYASGISETYPLKNQTIERMQHFFEVNYFGFMEVVRQCCRAKHYNEGFRIVGISSTVAILGEKAHSLYAGTKGAMDASIRCLAQELAPKRICVNAVAPGMTNTDMYQNFLEQWGYDSDVNQDFLKKQYLGIIQPEYIANMIAFLLSDAARYITGLTIPVDAGLTTSY